MNLAAFASSSLSPARSNNSANNNLTSCDETTNSTSVGYLILSSLGDPLLETWKFAPSHHGTRPDPNLVGRMVISSLAVGNNNNNNSKKNSVPKSTTFCISLNNYKNEDEEEENENHQEDDDYKNREHFLHIFALEFSVGGGGDKENSISSNNNFVSVVMRIISKSTSLASSTAENEEGGFDLQHYFLSSRSWSDLCALSIWFSSILSIDWLLPLAANIESIAQTQHKEENFTTQQVLNNTNRRSNNDTNKKNDDDNNVVFNKVIRMFHSSSSIQERNMNPALLAALNFEVSSAASPSPRKDGSQTAPPQQVSPSASLMAKSPSSSSNSQKLKYNNSLSVCHEMFLVALRICLIINYEKNIANENNPKEQQQTDEEKQAQKELQTNSKAVTMEADVILDDLQQQILNRPSFIDSHFYRQGGAKENVIGVALVPQQQEKESDDKNSKKYQPLWILQPRRLQTLTAAVDDDDEDIIDDKTWKHTICSRLLKLLEKKTVTKKTDDEGSNTSSKSKPISNVAFRFFGEKIEVLMNEISIDQDDEEEAYFHSLNFGDDEKKMKTKWRTFSVILEC